MTAQTALDAPILEMVRQAMLDVLVEPRARRGLEALTMDTELASLGVDSVTTIEIVASLEDRTGLLLAEDRLVLQRSVGDIVRYVSSLIKEKESA